jgi:hypothetical protein
MNRKGLTITLGFILLGWICFSFSGCYLFEPRKAEEPVGQVKWNHFPIVPGQTLENLLYSYNHSENADRYELILSEDFRFYFDAQDVHDFSFPVFWNKESEVNMRSLINEKMRLELTIIPDQADVVQSETAALYRSYELEVLPVRERFAGKMVLNMLRSEDGFWRIESWEDIRQANEATWGRFKYETFPQ